MDRKKVNNSKRHQRLNEVPYTLRERQKELVLDTFKHECALTEKYPDVDLDHFVPVGWGKTVKKHNIGGTTYENMIPLHASINRSKGSHNPFVWFELYGEKHGVSRDKWDGVVGYIANKHGLSSIEYKNRVNTCYSEVLAEKWITTVNSNVKSESFNLLAIINRALRINLNIPVVVEKFGSKITRQLFKDNNTIRLINEQKKWFESRLRSK